MPHNTSINPLGVPLLNVGRDIHGRFSKANPGGPGNPFARKVAALRKTLLDSVSEQELKEMIEILKKQALQGDKCAIKLILQYCVGKPAPPHDPDRMDADEWQRLRQMSVGHQQFQKTIASIPACLACHRAESSWPCEAQEGDGPLQQTIHFLHKQLQASDQGAAQPSKNTSPESVQPGAEPVRPSATVTNQTEESNTLIEPSVPTAERPSSAKSTERREPVVHSRRASHSPTQPPLPNGRIEGEQQQTLELLQRFFQPAQPSEQSEREPPPR